MNEDVLNMSIRKFLKQVGITSQREIEQEILKAIDTGKLSASNTLAVSMTLEVPELDISHTIDAEIHLE